ncbi:hypothetical protein [Flavobacterium sp. GCM10023249]|uniref:hypothetical protein n=1 Tax=unclassified Flavobacterium TaxID=196869 RepID=UPI00361A0202
MANQKGLIALDGTLEGINFYIRKGKPVARKAGGGFTSKSIKTNPSMVRVRENGSEFGHCSKVKKQLRLALLPFMGLHHDSSFHGRMMRMLQEVKNCDSVSKRGQRTVHEGLQTAMGSKLFADFAFTDGNTVKNTLQCDCRYTPTDHTLTLDRFDISKVAFPSASTHVEIRFGVLAFDFTNLTFTLHESLPWVVSRHHSAIRNSLVPTSVPDHNTTLFVFCGIRFYQEINDVPYILKGDNTLHLNCLEVYP